MTRFLMAVLLVATLASMVACGGESGSAVCSEGEVRCYAGDIETCKDELWVVTDCDKTCKGKHYSGSSSCQFNEETARATCICESCVSETPEFCYDSENIPVCDSDGTWKSVSCKNWCNQADNGDFLDGESCTTDTVGAKCDCFDCQTYTDCPALEDMCDQENRRCVDAYQYTWRVTIYSASSTEKKDGAQWDPLGGLPDLYATMYVNDQAIYSTETTADSTSATWDESFEYKFGKTAEVRFTVWDEDIDTSDQVGGMIYNTANGEVSVADLEAGGFVFETDDGYPLQSLTVYFERVE